MHVAEALNITPEQISKIFERFPRDANGKPTRPKEAMEYALKLARKPRSASIYLDLASKVSLKASEAAFDRFRTTLQTWFPLET